jgi:endonuclease YncB( thermonuclease family)
MRLPLLVDFRRWSLLVAIALAIAPAAAGAADDLVGRASVIDGDTIEIHGMRIRLWGIDAPESDQLCRGEDSEPYRCGQKAAAALAALLYAVPRPVACVPTDLDKYGRTVAICSVRDPGPDIGHWLVSNGLALDWPQYSKGKYDDAQRKAKEASRGIWSGSFVEPWLYRACIRASGRPAACSDDANAHP